MTLSDMLLAHQRSMMSFAKHLCGNTTDAQDVAQSANLTVLKRGLPGAGVEYPKAWLNQFVLNEYRSRRHREARFFQPESDEIFDVMADGPQEYALELKRIGEAVARMPAKQASAFMAIAVDGYTSREAADILGYADHKGVLYQYHKAADAVLLAA